MDRSVTLVLVGALLLSVVTAGSAVGAEPSANAQPADGAAVQPGERLSGAVATDNAEIGGEISERGFGIAIAAANTNESRAEVVAQRLDRIEERLAELEARKAELDDKRESNEITEGRYRAEVARLEAERASAERMTNRSAAAIADVPADVLTAHGIDREKVETLQERANELTGPEVASIAREIAGADVGQPPSAGPPDERGPSDVPGQDDVPPPIEDGDEDDEDEEESAATSPLSVSPPTTR